MNTIRDPSRRYAFLCPQCGSPTHGSVTSAGRQSWFCEDCVGDRDIDDSLSLAE